MAQTVGYYVDLSTVQLSDGDVPVSWVHALPGGTYKHPVYGKMEFSDDRIQNFADSVTNKTRKIDPDIDYDHKTDKAMGNKAAGWVKAAEARPSADNGRKDLWLLVEWTPAGAQSIKNKEYRYFSSEICDEWEDAEGNKHKDVLLGGGITNRPYMKTLLPLNLSELVFSDDRPNEGEQVDPKKLRQQLGLAETATDAEVDAKLSELTKLQDPPKDDPNAELLKLAETNPLVKAFLAEQEKTRQQLAEMEGKLKLSNVTRQLSELTTNPKIALNASSLNAARDLMMAAPSQLSEQVFGLLKGIADGSGVQELGERGGSGSGNDRGQDDDPTQRFNDLVKKFQTEDKVDYGVAVERAAFAEPGLYDQYRRASYIRPQQ